MADEDVYMAKLAEQAERYEEMVEYMKKVATAASDDLSLEVCHSSAAGDIFAAAARTHRSARPPRPSAPDPLRARTHRAPSGAQSALGRLQERRGRAPRIAADHQLD